MSSFIIAAKRTAVAPRGGALSRQELHQLGAPVVQACLAQAGIAPDEVDELIAGNALGAGGNPARLVALAAGLPETVAGLSIDRQCCGGLDALLLADAMIRSGQAQIVVAGGVESYSRRPLRFRTAPDGGGALAYDQPPFVPWPDRDPDMAVAADQLSREMNITGGEQMAWAVESHRKALSARDQLTAETVPVAETAQDSFARALTPALCARAKTITGTITAANAAVAADAAAFCVVVSEDVAARLGRFAVRVVGGRTMGDRPELPGLAPVAALNAVLQTHGCAPETLSVAEIMEAYAVQAIACVQGAGINPAITNPGGGALARGHPIGASGAILAVRLYRELQARAGHGVAAIAAAGGLGTALLLQA